MKQHETAWNCIKLHGTAWNCMESHKVISKFLILKEYIFRKFWNLLGDRFTPHFDPTCGSWRNTVIDTFVNSLNLSRSCHVHQCPRCTWSLEIVAYYMELHGTTWNYMKLHETAWNSMKQHETAWNSMKLHETAWNCMELHGITQSHFKICNFKRINFFLKF
jgi:hypothetical protein